MIPLVQCPDRKGLGATIAEFIYRNDGNILHFEQHQAGQERYMNWALAQGNQRPRVAIFVSKYDHCLMDLLQRQRNGEMHCDFPLIVSSHADAKRHADFFSVPFVHIFGHKGKRGGGRKAADRTAL